MPREACVLQTLSVWAQYTIRLPAARRDAIAHKLKEQGISTQIFYPRPLHRQPAFQQFPVSEEGVPQSERLAHEVLSLPMHPYLDPAEQAQIIAACRASFSLQKRDIS